MFLQKLYLYIIKVNVPKNQKFTPDLMEPFMYVEKVTKNLFLIIQLTFNLIQLHVKPFMRYVNIRTSVPIFNKISHRTRAVETFKHWLNFENFHSSCSRMGYFVENCHTESQRHKGACKTTWTNEGGGVVAQMTTTLNNSYLVKVST